MNSLGGFTMIHHLIKKCTQYFYNWNNTYVYFALRKVHNMYALFLVSTMSMKWGWNLNQRE